MGPRKVFSERDVITASCAIIRREGWAAVSARSIARELGSSTMPVYSTLTSMRSLETAVRGEIYTMLLDYQKRSYSSNTSLDQALGYVHFARNEPRLFQFLFSGESIPPKEQEHLTEIATRDMDLTSPAYALFNAIDSDRQNSFVLKNWIYLHGLAVLVSGEVLAGMSDERIELLVTQAAEAFYTWELQKSTTEQTPCTNDNITNTTTGAEEP